MSRSEDGHQRLAAEADGFLVVQFDQAICCVQGKSCHDIVEIQAGGSGKVDVR